MASGADVLVEWSLTENATKNATVQKFHVLRGQDADELVAIGTVGARSEEFLDRMALVDGAGFWYAVAAETEDDGLIMSRAVFVRTGMTG